MRQDDKEGNGLRPQPLNPCKKGFILSASFYFVRAVVGMIENNF
jgi:hypothetical protein